MFLWNIRNQKHFFPITRGSSTHLSLDGCTMDKSKGFFARVLVHIDMLFVFPNQILVERSSFALL